MKVCQTGKQSNWLCYEPYHARPGDTVKPAGTFGYCEYPATLARVVLSSPEVLSETDGLRKRVDAG